MTDATPADDGDDALLRFVEKFAFILMDSGLPRMPARVFAYVLAADDDDGRYTASQLAQGLRVSPAAISGAVQALVRSGLLAKEREPGSRADHYRVFDDDIWSNIMADRLPILDRYTSILEEGIEQIAPGHGADRLAETLDYIRFMRREMQDVQERWQKHLQQRQLERAAES